MLSIIESGALSKRILGTVVVKQPDYASGFTGTVTVAGTTEDAYLALSIRPMEPLAPGPSQPKPSAPPLSAPLPLKGDPPSNGIILRPSEITEAFEPGAFA